MHVKFGMADTPREVDVEVDDADALIAELERALEAGDRILWVTEEDGRRYGLVVDRIVFVDVEPERNRSVGFSH